MQSSAAADSSKMNENLPLDKTVERFWSLTGMDLKENRREIGDVSVENLFKSFALKKNKNGAIGRKGCKILQGFF